jgi:outer membrane biosynthesis protein TonB
MPRMSTPKKAPKKSTKSPAKKTAKPTKSAPKRAPTKAAKPAAKKSPAKASKPAPSPRGKAGTLTSDQALARYTPLALQLAKKDVLVCRLDLALALHNLQLGVASIEPYAARLRKEVPGLPLAELLALPDLGLALIFANEQAEPANQGQNRLDLARLRELREPMLHIAEGLAMLGLVPEKTVQAIRAGSGAMDAARDGIALCALYRAHAAALAGKHPFTQQDFDEISELGERLTRTIVPEGSQPATRRRNRQEAQDLSNRLYTLLVLRHQELRKAGYYLFGPELDTKVPTLAARRATAKAKKPAPAKPAAPAPTLAPTPNPNA